MAIEHGEAAVLVAEQVSERTSDILGMAQNAAESRDTVIRKVWHADWDQNHPLDDLEVTLGRNIQIRNQVAQHFMALQFDVALTYETGGPIQGNPEDTGFYPALKSDAVGLEVSWA